MTTPYEPLCCHCGDPVQPAGKGTWREVTGWVQSRSGGGAHGVRDQHPTGRYACRTCIDLIRIGVSPGQERMW